MKQKQIEELRRVIQTKDIRTEAKNTALFGGADIVICYKLPDNSGSFSSESLFVVTKHAKELSWLIYQLKHLFHADLDYFNKYSFYGLLAERASNFILFKGDNLIPLLLDVLEEADRMDKLETNSN